jgi:hypothetical protein
VYPRQHAIALVIDIFHTEARIYHRLIWIRRWAAEIVERESRHPVVFGAALKVKPARKLICIRIHFG